LLCVAAAAAAAAAFGPGGGPCLLQVQQLKSQLGEACHFNTQLTGLIENKDEKLNILKDHFSQIKSKYQVGSGLTVPAAGMPGHVDEPVLAGGNLEVFTTANVLSGLSRQTTGLC